MIIILFLAVYRVAAFSVRFHMEPCMIQACHNKEPFPGKGMELNPCVPHETSGFYMELYENHLSGG